MKKVVIIIMPTLLIFQSCKNGSKDSVEKADSANKTHIDSPATTVTTVMTDEESSSFLVKAADEGMAEAQLGEMAREKAVNKLTRNFGAMMVRMRGTMNDEIKDLASKRNVILPASISEDNRKKIDNLSATPRKDFDKAYLELMIKDHESAMNMFSSAGKKVNDTDVRNFISNSVPKMKNSLDSAKTVRRSL